MLKRAFGQDAVAVRVNAAGQGDFFQVHVDRRLADPSGVKRFLNFAFYRRFGLDPQPRFVEVHPGGGAVGIRLSRFDDLPQVMAELATTPGDTICHRIRSGRLVGGSRGLCAPGAVRADRIAR